jgi:hypothetical protein
MITEDLIKENVSGIPEEHVKPLVELVNNTFTKELETEVGKVRGNTFGLIDETLKGFGYPKVSGKTTDHLTTVLTTLKENMLDATTKQKMKEQGETIANLQEKLKDGNPDFSKKEQDFLDKIKTLEGSLEEKEELFNTERSNNKTKLLKFQLLSEMPKIKEGIGDLTKDLHVNKALEDLIKSADFNDNDEVVFRDKDGAILYNSANKNNPFTIKEMFEKNEYFKTIMHIGVNKNGTGLKPDNNKDSLVLDLSGAKTKVEANDMIEKMLLSQGLNKLSEDWTKKYSELRKQYNIDELPLR